MSQKVEIEIRLDNKHFAAGAKATQESIEKIDAATQKATTSGQGLASALASGFIGNIAKANPLLVVFVKGMADSASKLYTKTRALASATNGVGLLRGAFIRLIAVPIVALLSAIPLALSAIVSWMKRTDEGSSVLRKGMAYLSQAIETVMDIATDLGEALFTAFTKPQEAVRKLWNLISGAPDRLSEFGAKANERARLMEDQANLEERRSRQQVARAKAEKEVATLEAKIADSHTKINEKKAASRRIDELRVGLAKEELSMAREQERITKGLNGLTQQNAETRRKNNEAEAERIRQEAKLEDEKRRTAMRNRQIANEGKSHGGSALRAAREDAQERRKLFELAQREEEEQAEQQRALKDAITNRNIAQEQDNAKRELMQMEKDHQDKLEAIRRQSEEWKKEAYKAAEDRWNATNKDKTKTFTDTAEGKAGWQGQQLSSEQEQIIQAQVDAENAIYARGVKERLENEMQSMRDYLKKYGSISQKKQAIAEEYDKKIAETRDKWLKKSLEEEKKKALNAIDIEVLRTEIDWTTMFDGIGDALHDEMVATLEKIEKYIQTDSFKALSAQEKAEYVKMRNELVSKTGGGVGTFDFSIYSQIGEDMKAYQKAILAHKMAVQSQLDAETELENAKKALAEAEAELAAAEGDEAKKVKAGERIKAAQNAVADAQNRVTFTSSQEQQAQTNVQLAQGNLTRSTTQAQQALDGFKDALGEITNGTLHGFVNGIVKLVQALGGKATEGLSGLGKAGGLIGAILSIIDALGSSGIDTTNYIEQLFDKIINVIGSLMDSLTVDLEKGSPGNVMLINKIYELLSRVIESTFLNVTTHAFGLGDVNTRERHQEEEKRREELTTGMEAATAAIEHWTEELEKSYGIMALQNKEKIEEQSKKQMESIIQGIDSVLTDSYGGGHSDYWHVNKAQSVLEQINGYGKQYGVNAWEDSQGKFTWQELLRNDPQALAKMFREIQQNDPELWRTISTELGYNGGKLEEWIQKLIDVQDSIEAAEKQAMEQLTTTTSDKVFDDFLDSLYELADGSEDVMDDIAENWQKMVNRMVINNFIANQFQDELAGWYQSLYDLNNDYTEERIGKDEYQRRLDELKAKYDGYVDDAQSQIEQFRDLSIIQAVDVEEAADHFDDLRSKFLDTLMDMEGDAEDFRKEMSRLLVQDLMEKQVFDVKMTVNGQDFENFDAYAKDWNRRYSEALEAGDEALLQALIDELVAQQEAMAEAAAGLRDRLKETVEDTTFKDMTDSWISSLEDMEKTADDWAQDVGKTMVRHIISNMIAPTMMQPLLDNLQDAINAVMGQDGATWQDVVADGSVRAALDAIKNAYPELQEAVRQIYDALGVELSASDNNPFDDLEDQFLSVLTDIEKDAEDWAKDFGKKLTDELIKEFVMGDAFKEKIEEYKESLKEIMGDPTLSAEERARQLRELVKVMQGFVSDKELEAEEWMKLMGTYNPDDQEATMNMADKATYDQFELFLGIATGQELLLAQQKEIQQKILETVQASKGITSSDTNYGEEIFNRLGTTNEYLLATKKLVSGISEKLDAMNSYLNKL
jgi:DNA repair exonuclease SbcCD ATPase subunit